jgi:signal transduction histidine kinase
MRVLPGSLKGQLILLTLVATLLSQAAGLLFILEDQRSRMRTVWLHNVFARVATAKEVIEATPPELHAKILKSVDNWALLYTIGEVPAASAEADVSASLRDQIKKVFRGNSDRVMLTFDASLNEEPLIELLFGDLWRDIRQSFTPKNLHTPPPAPRLPYAHISIPLEWGGWLNVAVLQRGLNAPAWPLLVQFATMAAISAAGIILVLGRLTRPLKGLAKAASALGRGETSAKLDEKGPREVVETIHAFNEMQERLTTFVHDRAKMLAALGHDLRTPITTLRLRAEFIEDDDIREQILRTLEEMAEMAEASLSFAREEAAQEQTRLVDIGALASSVCEDLADAGLAVTCDDTGDFAVHCRPVSMKRALRNIVENAVTYGHCASVTAECKDGEARIVIEDEGPGIPVADMEKVFKPFVRLEQSRNKDTGGVGLGLAIARSIVRSHGGDILLQNRPAGGLRVVLTFCKASVLETPHLQGAAREAGPEGPHKSAA